jgi:hypothetical protein
MKSFIQNLICVSLCFILFQNNVKAEFSRFLRDPSVSTPFLVKDSTELGVLIADFTTQNAAIQKEFSSQKLVLARQLADVEKRINTPEIKELAYRKAIEERRQLERDLVFADQKQELLMLKTRYKKGIEIIKIIYEKLLALDHHFTGMQTYQNVMLLSNPTTYPDFQKAKTVMEGKMKKGFSLKMPAILNTNPYLSGAFTIVSSLLGEGDTKEKEKDLDKISCILDFTVRMTNDLALIYHETEYLKSSNGTLKTDGEKLFEDYTKVIGYMVSIEKCRKGDDWESLNESLDAYILKIEDQLKTNPTGPQSLKMKSNLDFATNRVADMVNKYRNYVTQGTQYYRKFDNIISSYQNENACQEKLPRQFTELKFDIKTTIEKFTNTYNLPEIEGSKLKDLMYGLME